MIRKKNAFRALALVAAIGSAGLAGCTNAWTSKTPTTGTIVVELPASLGRTARTILPAFAAEVESISVTVSAAGQTAQTQSAANTAATITFTGIAVATWTVDVSAFKSGTAIGSGSATVAVTSGSLSTVTVPIVFLGFAAGTGTLAIPLTWPSSSGVDYLEWSVDGGATSAASVATAAGGTCTTTLSTSLASGAHNLRLSFKAGGSGGADAGVFVETVDIWNGLTSESWIDGSGAMQSVMSFDAADFLDSDDNLGGLAISDAHSGSAMTIAGFSSSDTGYDLNELPTSLSGGVAVTPGIVFTATESMAGQYLSYTWNGGASIGIASGTPSDTLIFDTRSYDNTLAISVRAPNRVTTKVYIITWHSGAVTVGVDTPAYQNLTFASSSMIAEQGSQFQATCSDPTLAAVTTGWTWFVDGVIQSGLTSSSFALDEAATSQMLGDYSISCTVTFGGVAYSGGFLLTIARSSKRINP